jgi:hypothetical protein
VGIVRVTIGVTAGIGIRRGPFRRRATRTVENGAIGSYRSAIDVIPGAVQDFGAIRTRDVAVVVKDAAL